MGLFMLADQDIYIYICATSPNVQVVVLFFKQWE